MECKLQRYVQCRIEQLSHPADVLLSGLNKAMHMHVMNVYAWVLLLEHPEQPTYSAPQQESRFLPLYGFCSVLWLNLHVSTFDLISS